MIQVCRNVSADPFTSRHSPWHSLAIAMELPNNGVSQPTQPAAISGERRLVVALLEQAFQDLLMGSSANRSDASRWIREGDVGEISFNFCCEVIDWNAERIRTQVLKRVPLPKRFQNRAFAARKGWLARKRGDDQKRQSKEATAES